MDAVNVYYYLTYEGGADLDAIADPGLRRAAEAQVAPLPRRDKAERVRQQKKRVRRNEPWGA